MQAELLESWGKTEKLMLELLCESRGSIVWWELCRPELQPQDWELGLPRLSSPTTGVSLSPAASLGILNILAGRAALGNVDFF